MGQPYNGMLPALPANIRLGENWMFFSNTLAYYNLETIFAVKFFIVLAPVRNDFLSFSITTKILLQTFVN
jgi:hypothetical protein